MKPLTRIALPAALLLAACGDDITEINANVGAVETSKDLPECTKDIAGQTAFVSETHEFLGCDGSEWQSLSASTVSVGDNVCMSKSLSDDSGFEIFCNGESIGTVKNGVAGKDGVDGKDGEPGAKGDKGDDGAKGDQGNPGKNGTNGTNGTNGVGCEITEATTLTATIACGTESFTMDLTGYVELPAECDATHEDCTGPVDNVELSGVSQKGPFVTGTDITAYELENGRSLKQTGKTFGGKIEHADGTFDIKTVKLKSTFAYLVADGFYRNEVTGENSAATIKLRALTNLQGNKAAVNINLVTHLEYDRVQRLVTKEDSTVMKAKKAAEKEIFAAFDIDSKDFKGYAENYNILEEGDGNAALLAISVLLQGDRNESELTALLAALSVDLGDNGEWNNERQRAQIADWAMKKELDGGLPSIRANIKAWKLRDSEPPAFESHVTNFWMQELGVGECADGNEGEIFAIKNKKSAYYAANDSAFTEGDSSLVRLVCDASGAWRFATDLEKDTAAFDPSIVNATAMAGNVNTDFVYVKEGAWRRGTELDTALKFSCVADSVGKADSKIVNHETKWYICAEGNAEIPYAWREPTTAEADTVGFGTPDGEVARAGNVNKSLVYVFEDTSGKADYVWRNGTDLDLVSGLGACTKNRLDTVVKLPITNNSSVWYTCAVNKIIYVNGMQLPYAWREATDIEKDTLGWGRLPSITGAMRVGNVNKELVYVFENNNWRIGTALDRLLKKACIESKAASRDTSTNSYKNEYYVCTEQQDSDTLRKWVVAPDIYNDTIGSQAECKAFGKYGDGTILVGRANLQKKYACENGVFREANGEDINANRACVGYIQNHIYKVNGVFRKCVDHEWIRPNGKNLVGTLKTSDGQEYKTAVMADKLWMAQNLNSMTETSAGNCYRMVDANIGVDTVACDIHSACYDNKPENCSKYGRLYTRLAAQTACPAGWHLPSKVEWMYLLEAYATSSDGTRNRPYVLYATTDWEGISQERKDEFSFSILPAGSYNVWNGFKAMGWITYFWATGTEMSVGMSKDWNFGTYNGSADMFSVRCIQD